MSVFTLKGPKTNTLNIVVTNENKMSEVKIKMDHVNFPDKIQFHRQTTEFLYYDVLQASLANKNYKQRRKIIKSILRRKNQ